MLSRIPPNIGMAPVAIVLTLMLVAPAAGQPRDLFAPAEGPPVTADSPGVTDPATLRSRVVALDAERLTDARAAVSGPAGRASLRLNLFGDVVVTAILDRLEPTFSGGYALSGRIPEAPSEAGHPGTVTLVINGSMIVGTVHTSRGIYRIRSAGGERVAVMEIDPSALPSAGPPLRRDPPGFNPPPAERSPVMPAASAESDPDSVASDREALAALYEATGGASWSTKTNWLSDAPLGEWHGVTTDAAGRVRGLDLSRNGLSGQVPPELGMLTELRWLYLISNHLTGGIPPELGNLVNLQNLLVGGNLLTGTFPPLGSLTELRRLDLSLNGLSGPIPPELGTLANLQRLGLRGNLLTGPLPRELQSFAELEAVDVGFSDVCAPADADFRAWLTTIDFSGAFCESADELSIIDLAVFYTPSARQEAGGRAAVAAAIDLLVAATNVAYIDSGVHSLLRLVARQEVNYKETGDSSIDIGRLSDSTDGHMDEVHTIRDQVGADLVSLVADSSIDACRGYLPGAFSLCSHYYGTAFAHELGHNMGLHHDRFELCAEIEEAPCRGGVHPFSFGYVNQRMFEAEAPESSRWLTIMSYGTQCQAADVGCSSLFRFSNPEQTWLGDPLGTPGDAFTTGAHGPTDAVRTLNLARGTVANFRASVAQEQLDRTALTALYEATGGAQWTTQTNWLSDAPLEDWHGVTTDGSGRVSALALGGNALRGALPSEVGTLTGLETLNLAHNALTGPLPRAVWTLTNLRELHVQGNGLTGSLDGDVATPRNLQELNLGGNALSGPLPREVGTLASLRELELSATELTGPLPAGLTSLSLERLRIVGSGLCAPSDAAFQRWLQTIDEFAGATCPAEAGGSASGDRAALEALYHATDGPNWRSSTNWLSAKPLDEWEGVSTDSDGRVTRLYLGWIGLTGKLPAAVGALGHLQDLTLSGNPELTGLLPPEVGNLSRLEYLRVFNTGLRGPLPRRVGRLANLLGLFVGESRMRGPVPQDLASLAALRWLDFSETALCAPANDAFQTWLAGVESLSGVQACRPAEMRVAPEAVVMPASGVQSIAVEQSRGGAPAAWTADSTEAWLRVTPAAGMGGGLVTVAFDASKLPSERGGELRGTVVVRWDGLSVRVPVTVPPGTAGAAASLSAVLPVARRPGLGLPETGKTDISERDGRDVRDRVSADNGPPRDHLAVPASLAWRAWPSRSLGAAASVRTAPGAASPDSADVAADRAALTALYNATDGPNWSWNQHWLSDKPLGDWWGVATDDGGRVTGLYLGGNGLAGRIPSELGDLTALGYLDLGHNRLRGGIPGELGKLANAWALYLDDNDLTGAIPAALGNMAGLWGIYLGGNALTGRIPSELGGLSGLQRLNLAGNRLTGAIPPGLGKATRLRELNLGDNQLTGTIPPELGDLAGLDSLHLQGNGLTGTIPAALGQLSDLVELDLSGNHLTGAIPLDLGGLPDLEVLDLSGNELTGPIPVELGAPARLWWLSLRDNELTGSIPPELESLGELLWLDLAGNALADGIPPGLGKFGHLLTLSLGRNRLTGSIPAALATLPALERLYLGDNQLAGPIPAGFGDLPALEHLSLPNNGLTGRLPTTLAGSHSLEVLDVADNALTGSLPQQWEAAALAWLDVAGNTLTGGLSSTVGDLASLGTLSLSGNRFSGRLPDTVTRLYRLNHLWMAGSGLCAPADAAFQGWLAGLAQFEGASCGASGAAPVAVTTLTEPRRGGAGGASGARNERPASAPIRGRRGTPPVGQVETPVQGATAVRGTIGLTGWVRDDDGTPVVTVYRDCLPFDDSTRCESAGGEWLLRLGTATVVPGARPDVEAAYPETPPAQVAGWGYVMSSQLLPDVLEQRVVGGEGPLALYVVATGSDGHSVRLGRTLADEEPTRITLANRSLAQPFGVIETPAAGSRVRGVVSTVGWALTPDANTSPGEDDDVLVPVDGTTTVVYVDGQAWGSAAYDQCRGGVGSPVPAGAFCDDDVANMFGAPAPRTPGTPRAENATRFRNLDMGRGAIAGARIDTTALTDGAHTLSWSVTDSAGRTAHLGTRYIIVANGSTATGASSGYHLPVAVAPGGNRGVQGRQGWNPGAPWEELAPDGTGVRHVTLPVLGRLELHLGGSVMEGHLLGPDGPRPLPPGSRLAGATGAFTWGMGPGYLGTYALEFVRPSGASVPVTVTIAPPADVTAGVVRGAIDAPKPSPVARRSFTLKGWALDEAAWTGAGVDAVEVWARRLDVPGATPVFIGTAVLGQHRPAVAAAFGAQFDAAGWELAVGHLPPGLYDLTAYFRATVTGSFEVAHTLSVTIR